MSPDLTFSSNRENINLDFVADFLSNESYWAKGRERKKIEATIMNSFCLSMFSKGSQIGFARVVTDYETFAYIMDVFVDRELRNQGYGEKLMNQLLSMRELINLPSFHLKTIGAEAFYRRLGFIEIGGGFMQLKVANEKS